MVAGVNKLSGCCVNLVNRFYNPDFMPDILHDFFIAGEPSKVYDAIAQPAGINSWWSETCSGKPKVGETYDFGFGPEYQWQAVVSKCDAGREFEFRMTKSDDDWRNSKLTFIVKQANGGTQVNFAHTNWPEANEHFRISSYCWAMYLRHLKMYVEKGAVVPYKDRLEV